MTQRPIDLYWQGTAISSYFGNIDRKIADLISKRKYGYSWGSSFLDINVGLLKPGEIHIKGAPSGVGKSYDVIRTVNTMLNMPITERPRAIVFSTEMSAEQYFFRLLAHRLKMWVSELERILPDSKELQASVEREKQELFELFTFDQDSFRIAGNIGSFESLEEVTEKYKMETGIYPHLVFIDYIQALSVTGTKTVQEAMAALGTKLLAFTKKTNACVIIISQINNYALSGSYNQKDSLLTPLSYGKELLQAANSAVILSREKVDGAYIPALQVHITKSRDGITAMAYARILPGYNLEPMTKAEYELMRSRT